MKSLLFIPGNNPSMLQNAFIFDSEYVILDLEDAVSVEEKDAARELVKNFLEITSELNRVIVRVNDIESDYFIEDMQMLLKFEIAGVMLPKATVAAIDKYAAEHEHKLFPIIESCIAVMETPEIVKNELVVGVLLGGEDLSSDLEVQRTKDSLEILYPRQKIAYACKAYGKVAIDTPVTSVNDQKALIVDSKFAKNLGFKAKACIHPNQVQIVNQVFMVSEEEYLWGQRVLTALESQENSGAFSLDGKMIDEPIIQRARRFVEEGEMIYDDE